MKRQHKKKNIWRMLLTGIGVILLAAVILGIGAAAALLIRFNNTAYEYERPVERDSEYVMPEYPELTPDTDAAGTESDVMPETLPQEESVQVMESEEITIEPDEPAETDEPRETVQPEETKAEPETDLVVQAPVHKPEETKKAETVPETVHIPPETLPQTVNPPPSVQETSAPAETIALNPDASFGKSQNTVSVYAGVPIYKVKQKDSDIVNILLLGTDSRDVTLDRGRSDTMMIASYNAGTGEVKLTSLLRDSLVPIEGVGWNRINTAYFYGGVGLAVNTVNQLYDLDIQQFIVIDFNGVKDFIDYIGGVDLTFTEEELWLYNQYWGTSLEPGVHHCDSRMTLTHMQNRDIGSDFARTQRQRDVISAVVSKILGEKSPAEILDIADYAFGLIKTNISAKNLLSYAVSVLANASALTIESQTVPYADTYQFAQYKGMSVLSYDIADAASRINGFIYKD